MGLNLRSHCGIIQLSLNRITVLYPLLESGSMFLHPETLASNTFLLVTISLWWNNFHVGLLDQEPLQRISEMESPEKSALEVAAKQVEWQQHFLNVFALDNAKLYVIFLEAAKLAILLWRVILLLWFNLHM